MPEEKCPVCKKDHNNCQCRQVCKVCLKNGTWSTEPTGVCSCCKLCNKTKSECQCDKTPPPNSWRQQAKPPDMGLLKDKSNLDTYILGLKRWARMGGVKASEQGDYILMMANRENPELSQEMERNFKDDLANDPEATVKIINWLEDRFGVHKQADLIRLFSQCLWTQRKQNQDIISFINDFTNSYSEISKLGEHFSHTARAQILLQNVVISDADRFNIEKDIDWNNKDNNIQQSNYEKIVQNLKALQYGRVNNAASRKKPAENTLLTESLDLDDFTEDDLHEIKTWILHKRQGGGRGRGGGRGGQKRGGFERVKQNTEGKERVKGRDGKPWKCKWCLCECKRYMECQHECCFHRHWECPTRKKEGESSEEKQYLTKPQQQSTYGDYLAQCGQGGAGYDGGRGEYYGGAGNSWLVVPKVIDEREADQPQPLELFLQQNEEDLRDQEILLVNKEDSPILILVDSGSPSTIIGRQTFTHLLRAYPSETQKAMKYKESKKAFAFGGGEKAHSVASAHIPVWLTDVNGDIILVNIWTEIINLPDVPFLLGGRAMKKANTDIKLGSGMIKFDIAEDNKLKPKLFNLIETDSGHFKIKFKVRGDWKDSAKFENAVVHYVCSTKSPNWEEFKFLPIETFTVEDKKPLGKKEVQKLHHFFGHPSYQRLKQVIINAGRYNKETEVELGKLRECEVCKVENRAPPKPSVALPRADHFNHIVALDLKENIRYPSCPPYILYMVDQYSRFTMATFIKNKEGGTVAEALVREWIRNHGVMKVILSDRGKEFCNRDLAAVCNLHHIQFITTASYSPTQNSICERRHYYLDKCLEKMVTADPSLSPITALAWSLHAANSIEVVKNSTPYLLAFGRQPSFPALDTNNTLPSNDVEDLQISKNVIAQHKAMILARETFVQQQSDLTIKKALLARMYTDPTDVKVSEWIYFKQSRNRYWVGPVKVLAKEGKKLFVMNHGQLQCVNSDDVLLHKPGHDHHKSDKFVTLPDKHQPATAAVPGEPRMGPGEDNGIPDQPPVPGELRKGPGEHSVPGELRKGPGTPRQQTSTATIANIDLGQPVSCNLCEAEMSSKTIVQHCRSEHNVLRGNIRQLSTVIKPRPDSVYENRDRVKVGVTLATRNGEYIELLSINEDGSRWTARNLNTKQQIELDTIADLPSMRVVGQFDQQDGQGIFVINYTGQRQHHEYDDYKDKVFFTSPHQYNEEEVFVVNIPRSRHHESECVAAKEKELQDFADYDVYQEVPRPKAAHIISTEWVLVEKEKLGRKYISARLCIRGDMEKGLEFVKRDSPTCSKVAVKITLAVANAFSWDIKVSDISRAFLQTEEIDREVYVQPPTEANVPRGTVWILTRPAYGLVDASRSFFLNHAKSLKLENFNPLRMDPATFINEDNGTLRGVYCSHVDDSLSVGQKTLMESTHKKMMERFQYGTSEQLPTKFLGVNISRDGHALVLDQEDYIRNIVIPDVSDLNSLAKQDILPDQHQSMFRSIASRLNTLAMSCRPDCLFTAKYLTTRYGKATKSDMTTAVRMLKKIKQEDTSIIIPNIGPVEEWIIVASSDASARSNSSIFAVAGYIIFLMNRVNNNAIPLHWTSKKIRRVVNSSLAAETLAMTELARHIHFIRDILRQMFGEREKNIPCLVLTDSHDLWVNIHQIKASTDLRLQADIYELREAVKTVLTIQEIRHIPGKVCLADTLTKISKSNAEALMNVLRTGVYKIPGGSQIRDSTKIAAKTWTQLMDAEEYAAAQTESDFNQ